MIPILTSPALSRCVASLCRVFFTDLYVFNDYSINSLKIYKHCTICLVVVIVGLSDLFLKMKVRIDTRSPNYRNPLRKRPNVQCTEGRPKITRRRELQLLQSYLHTVNCETYTPMRTMLDTHTRDTDSKYNTTPIVCGKSL